MKHAFSPVCECVYGHHCVVSIIMMSYIFPVLSGFRCMRENLVDGGEGMQIEEEMNRKRWMVNKID